MIQGTEANCVYKDQGGACSQVAEETQVVAMFRKIEITPLYEIGELGD